LAALKDPGRKPEILADVRPGTFDDALRFAMQANSRDGKRLTEKDYKRAIELAIEHDLIKVEHVKDVVPAIVEMMGCAVRTAQVHSADYRAEMIAKRGRLIWTMHAEGRSQEAIGATLEVAQQTAADVIKRITGKRKRALSGKANRPDPPLVAWSIIDPPAEAAETADRPASKVDMSPFLPLLDRMRPLDEGGDDTESGAVGLLDDVDADTGDEVAIRVLARMDKLTTKFLEALERRTEQLSKRRFPASASETLLDTIDAGLDFFAALRTYLKEIAS
jgi:hypothetical protein